MFIPPKYILRPDIVKLLQEIEASREVIDTINIPPAVEMNLRRQSNLKSSLYSARIEGNPLTLQEITTPQDKDQRKVEVFNILKALNIIHQKGSKKLTIKDILKLHKIVMNGLKADAGEFRREVGAIFNTAGVAIYIPPPPTQVFLLTTKLIKFANGTKEPFIPIKAALAHYTFEKIHPFLDGNGRVGRLLLAQVLKNGGYGMKGIVPIEEYLDTHRSQYYQALEEPEKNVTNYLIFMLEALSATAEQAKKIILEKKEISAEDSLLPRREEILNLIRDHKLVNFDQIRRRFISINERTLRYDLKKLADAGFIHKRGATKGVHYEAKG